MDSALWTADRVNTKRAPKPGPSLSALMRPPWASHYPLADRQPQAGSVASHIAVLSAGELAEQARQVLGGYPPPLVGHRDLDVNARAHGGHQDGRLRGVFGRVRQQVADDLDDAPAVRHHQGQVGSDFDGEVASASSADEGVAGSVHQRGHFHRLRVHRQGASLDAGHVQQVADELPHVVGPVDDDPVELAHLGRVQISRRVQEGGGRAQDGGKGHPQLVAHHGQKLHPQPLHLLHGCHVLHSDNNRDELGFRLATTGARYLATELEERKAVRKTLVDFYSMASTVIHGDEPSSSKRSQLADKATVLCGKGILRMLEQQERPDWGDFLLS